MVSLVLAHALPRHRRLEQVPLTHRGFSTNHLHFCVGQSKAKSLPVSLLQRWQWLCLLEMRWARYGSYRWMHCTRYCPCLHEQWLSSTPWKRRKSTTKSAGSKSHLVISCPAFLFNSGGELSEGVKRSGDEYVFFSIIIDGWFMGYVYERSMILVTYIYGWIAGQWIWYLETVSLPIDMVLHHHQIWRPSSWATTPSLT